MRFGDGEYVFVLPIALEKVGPMEKTKLIYVASPYAGEVRENVKNARRYCKFVMDEGHIPYAPHLLFTQFLDDDIPTERALGLDLGLQMIYRCDELWAFGDISSGMQKEVLRALNLDKPIKRFNEDCQPMEVT